MRHGKPVAPMINSLNACEMPAWLKAYDLAGINQHQQSPATALDIAANCNAVVCSDLPRSIQTVQALNLKHIHLLDPGFREIGLPYAGWNTPRLPPKVWVALFRTLWFLGYSSNGESLRSARLRARAGSEQLKKIAAEYGTVLFVGHGLINHLIAKELLTSGWQGPMSPGKRHWYFGVYQYR
jgi:broad specificity phosphatase PhoE